MEGGGGGGNAAASPGPAYSWVGSVDDANTGTGNKLTSVSLVSWRQRGGLPVDLTLNHNSQSTSSGELGPKWLTSYDATLTVSANGNVTVHWGDGCVYVFTKTTTGTYTAPPGIHDTLLLTSTLRSSLSPGQPYYRLTLKNQTQFSFGQTANPNLFRLGSISDENINIITVNYVAGTNLVQTVADATGRTLTFGYTNNLLTSVTDPLNRRWTLSYDGGGNLAGVSWPVINGASYAAGFGYDGNHNVTRYTDRRGNAETFSYNSDNSLAWEKDAVGSQTTFAYGSPSATATIITDANGHAVVHTYNAKGQLTSVTDALGYAEYYSYDGDNNVTQRKDRNGQPWSYTFDGMGNTLTAKDPSGNTTTYTYNTHNKLLTVTAPSGRSVANAYDALDNLTQVQQKDAAGSVKATTTFTVAAGYSGHGLVTDKYDANNHHTAYTYDANGYLSSVTTPMGRKTQWTYDGLGFQTSRTDAMGRTTTYAPDAWERNTKTSYPDASSSTYAYDANSNLTLFANYAGTWTRAYDGDNRMTAEYYGSTRDITHTYDGPGQKGLLSSVTDFDGRVISYAYSARNELAAVGDSAGTTSYTYDADGHQSHLYNPNGTRVDQYYNPDGSLHNYYNWNGGSVIFSSYGYSYNQDGQIVGTNEGTSTNTDVTPGPTQTAYGYDAQGHLTAEVRTGPGSINSHYSYDPAGNRTNFNNGSDNPFTYDADDEPTGAGGYNTFVLAYNANGDRISETINGNLVTNFGYDYDDRLTSITKPGQTSVYGYDALGRQVNKSVNGVLTGYYLDGEQILEEKTGSGTLLAQYVWGNGLVRCNGEYPLTDGRGSVRQTTNAGQQITSANRSDAFGVGSFMGGTASAYSFQASSGYRQDGIAPTGLSVGYSYQKVGARYYDPTLGCFLTRDTDLSQSPYAYCDGDPVDGFDPSGHKVTFDPSFKPSQGLSLTVTYSAGSGSSTTTIRGIGTGATTVSSSGSFHVSAGGGTLSGSYSYGPQPGNYSGNLSYKSGPFSFMDSVGSGRRNNFSAMFLLKWDLG